MIAGQGNPDQGQRTRLRMKIALFDGLDDRIQKPRFPTFDANQAGAEL
jgi:hypothetical protein